MGRWLTIMGHWLTRYSSFYLRKVANGLRTAWSEDKLWQMTVAAHSIISADVVAAVTNLSDAFYTDEPHRPLELIFEDLKDPRQSEVTAGADSRGDDSPQTDCIHSVA
jgi:hypothetical protein